MLFWLQLGFLRFIWLLFLGLSTFSKPGAFNAATSSTLFLGIGNSMGEDDDDDEDDEGDDDDGARMR